MQVVTADEQTTRLPKMRDVIAVATALPATGSDTPATVEVACLRPAASFWESRAVLIDMLIEQGMPIRGSADDPYWIWIDAFGNGLLTIGEFELWFYERLPAWDSQGPLDQQLVTMLHERDSQTDPVRKATAERQMRHVARRARRH